MRHIDLSQHGITVADVRRNLAPAELYAEALRIDARSAIADSGALIAYSGDKTGRSPKDKRIVRDPASEHDVWWGTVNLPIDDETFQINAERAKDYLNTREILYCVDAYAGWDPQHRLKVRVICSRPYHALFMHTMLIRPTKEDRDLQRRPVSGQPEDTGDDVEDEHRPLARVEGDGDPRHRVCRRDEEGCVHHD